MPPLNYQLNSRFPSPFTQANEPKIGTLSKFKNSDEAHYAAVTNLFTVENMDPTFRVTFSS